MNHKGHKEHEAVFVSLVLRVIYGMVFLVVPVFLVSFVAFVVP